MIDRLEALAREAEWTRTLPSRPALYLHRNLENAGGTVSIPERRMFVGYVNYTEDANKSHGHHPERYGSFKLRSVRAEHPLTTDSLTVQEWGCEWAALSETGGKG